MSVVYICWSQSASSSHPSSPLGIHRFVLSICVSMFALQINSSIPFFYILHICVNIHLFFSFWLIHSLWQTLGPPISLQTIQFRSFLWLSNIPLCTFFIRSSVDGHLGCFHVLTIVNSAAVNIRVHGCFLSYGILTSKTGNWKTVKMIGQ